MVILGFIYIFPPGTRMKLHYAPSKIIFPRLLWLLIIGFFGLQPVAEAQNLATWSFGSSAAPTTVAANVTVPDAFYTTTPTSPSISGSRFRAQGWNTASLDLTRYFEVSVTPNANFNNTMTQFAFNVQNTGAAGVPDQYLVAISNDNFVTSSTLGSGPVTSSATNVVLGVSTVVRIGTKITIRIYFWGATDATRFISIGSATITGTVQTPTFTATPVVLSGFSTTQGVPSASQTFALSGTNLVGTNTATLAAPAGYEVSTSSGSGFGASLTITPTNGSFASTNIYVRLTGTTQGVYAGNVVVSTPTGSGNNSVNIAVSGTVQPALPVSLISFKGRGTGNSVMLNWSTTSEQNSEQFVVQRSSDASEFISVGARQSAGTTDRQQYYSLTDESPRNGLNYYRLQQVDRDGSVVNSKPIAVRVDASQPYASLVENPTDGQSIQLKLYQMEAPQVRLSTLTGQTLAGQLARYGATAAVFAPASPLSPGLYVITVQEGAVRQAMKVVVK